MKLLYDMLAKLNPKFCPLGFKIVLGSVIVLAFVVPLVILAVPYVPFLNGMAVQPKGKAQMTYGWVTYDNELLLSGESDAWLTVERAAPDGAIPRGYQPYRLAGLSEQEIKDKGYAYIDNPTTPTVKIQQRGQQLFNVYCIVCHGKKGLGDGLVTQVHRANGFPTPPGWGAESLAKLSDGQIFHLITAGRVAVDEKTKKSKVAMPSYAKQLERADRWAIVQYVRALQKSKDASKVVK